MPETVPEVDVDAVATLTPPVGLDAEAVRERVARGLTNVTEERTSRTLNEILRDHGVNV